MELLLPKNDPAELVSIVFYYAQSSGVKSKTADVQQVTLKISESESETGDVAVALYLCRAFNLEIYPEPLREEIDKIVNEYPNYQYGPINSYLSFRTYLVGNVFTLADIAVFSAIHHVNDSLFRIKRWADLVSQQPRVKRYLGSHKQPEGDAPQQGSGKKSKGKLENVCTRFAPEPSGYLHIGHAKAALASEDFARKHNGTFVLRFDDTNPKNENKDFEEKILEDSKLLDIHPDRFERTSDMVPMILDTIKEMIQKDLAYVDDTPFEEIKQQRIKLQPSANRNNPAEKSLQLFDEMLKGTEKGFQCVARAKIDYKSQNGCMRDPVIARCVKVEHPHPGQGPVFPTYDLCCPIVDSKNGITHAMRSWEYTDRDHQYRWFIQALGLRPVEIVSFSRLSFNYTVLGKRYLRRLVENGKASGWDDPRFPTIRGLRRRGLQPATLRKFCKDQGASRNQNLHDWDKIWSLNREEILPVCHRVMNVSDEEKVVLNVAGATEGETTAQVLPSDKNTKRTLYTGPVLWIPEDDAIRLKEGEKVTLLNWTNVIVDKINKEGDKIKSIDSHAVDDHDYKKTIKINWIHPEKNTKIQMREWNHLLKVKQLGEDQDVIDCLSDIPWADTLIYCDKSIEGAKKGSLYQLERRGEIIIDEEAHDGQPAMTFLIPSGKRKIGLPLKIALATDAPQ
ncbi:hypothetical protein M9Y10_019106 [Tritrichomonas musculus]|uniref:GST C-terminal domain-containing protein n=1 Tax=Tritrichomonas musculus TaxID=1915356 RepID=A0ABR2HIJ5_9EUKA